MGGPRKKIHVDLTDPDIKQAVEQLRGTGEINDAILVCASCHRTCRELHAHRLCARCYLRAYRKTESHAEWGTRKTIRHEPPPDVDTSGMSEYCGNGHKWKPETTRWRWRDRGSHGSGWQRDCLICKDMADKARMHKTGRRGSNVMVTVTRHGTGWISGHSGGKDYS